MENLSTKSRNMTLVSMIASSPTWKPRKSYHRVRCALDNGAFQCWRRGFPFMSDVFRETLKTAYNIGLSLDFIVCPDILRNGWVLIPWTAQISSETILGQLLMIGEIQNSQCWNIKWISRGTFIGLLQKNIDRRAARTICFESCIAP